jgi:hypothetical protein
VEKATESPSESTGKFAGKIEEEVCPEWQENVVLQGKFVSMMGQAYGTRVAPSGIRGPFSSKMSDILIWSMSRQR